MEVVFVAQVLPFFAQSLYNLVLLLLDFLENGKELRLDLIWLYQRLLDARQTWRGFHKNVLPVKWGRVYGHAHLPLLLDGVLDVVLGRFGHIRTVLGV